ncbi:MAG: glutaredoxin 3 [Candidatus Thiodiazotropha lotti]|nr:glutaredoxin 3 [Candidatus Thiodiazotropha lotti]ODB99994.1 glutaredoxin 3 [Candidatus Thiodiazotropha endoloripes]MCG7922373.1 glutaredoxin 3 [Candidatus Thiodiazotropha lotti]MCG7930696.1 glutaredoxin 3 [Candidatus Thiodiazotropha lotti]MCG7987138.1 glutaredoxin 3 [Candidatus Thiodiazotropha lotti]
MNHIEIYSTNQCPWCNRAKSLLQAKGLDYEEIDVSSDQARLVEMVERSGRRTVPQIFIDDIAIGGFDELSKLDLSEIKAKKSANDTHY